MSFLRLSLPLARDAVLLGHQVRHYLAQSWDDERGINLYHCAGDGRGFFVEVGIDDWRGQAVVLRSFSSSGPLADYAQGVQLPGE